MWSIEKLKQLQKDGMIRGFVEKEVPQEFHKKATKRAHKYGARKTIVDGIEFPSRKEANRYKKLKILEAAGMIKDLELQVEFELNEGGTHSLKYTADFVYTDVLTKSKVVEDCKGFRTQEYKKRRRLMWKVHKIKIHET